MKNYLVSSLIVIGFLSFAANAATLIKDVNIVTAGNANANVADVLIQNGKIAGLGAGLIANSDTVVVDGKGKTLTAGFFNASTEIGLREVGSVADTVNSSTSNSRITASLRASDAINPDTVLIPHNRMLGLTHALVEPDVSTGLFAGTAAVIQLTDRDTIQKRSAGMVVVLGARGQELAGGSKAAAMAMLREAFEDARDLQRNRTSFNAGSRRDYNLSRHDLEALIPVLERKIPLIVHVDKAADISNVIEFANSNRLKLIVAGAEEGWRVAKQLADYKIPVIIDPIVNLPAGYDTLGARLDNAKILDQAGVTLLFTGMSWHNTHNAYLVRQSAGNAVANGLSYQTAIAAVTRNPAQVFGLDGMGEVKIGAKAHLVLWSGDPFEPSTVVEKVMINGVDQPLISRATRLRDRYFEKLKDAHAE